MDIQRLKNYFEYELGLRTFEKLSDWINREFREREIIAAENPEQCIDLSIELLTNPAYAKFVKLHTNEGYEIALLMGECGRIVPHTFIRKVRPLLDNPKLRLVIIEAIGWTNSLDKIEWLEPLINRLEELSEEEIAFIIDSIAEVGTHPEKMIKAKQTLNFIRAALPDTRKDNLAEIENAFAHIEGFKNACISSQQKS